MDQQLLQLKEDNDSDGPVALVSSNGRYRGFSKNRQISGFDCSVPGVYDFPAAQPAFVNSAAMRVLRSALDANGLTELQKIWGGSHDVNLGMLFWLYRIPLLSFFDAYVSVEIENETPPPGTVDASKAIVFHKVRHYQKKQAGAKSRPRERGRGWGRRRQRQRRRRGLPDNIKSLRFSTNPFFIPTHHHFRHLNQKAAVPAKGRRDRRLSSRRYANGTSRSPPRGSKCSLPFYLLVS